ncbi:hypothetical protein PG990_015380 [Apiospora arundinis]
MITYATHRSPFLSCPLEVRLEIYDHLIPNGIHIPIRGGRLTTAACSQPEENDYLSRRDGNGVLSGERQSCRIYWKHADSSRHGVRTGGVRRWHAAWVTKQLIRHASDMQIHAGWQISGVARREHWHGLWLLLNDLLFDNKNTEISDWAFRHTTVQITDLETLHYLAQGDKTSCGWAPTPCGPRQSSSRTWPGLTSVVVDLPKPHPRYETPERHFTPGSAIFASEWKKKALTDAASRL